MSLASIIRMEFAYPGVGVLAGDSIQYLSVATSHGVIMVFFMIMPAIFGAFGNFLLPTQLGVHDVAFPRLNSAAFWFLPGGLIMLCQLVCVDRRYQRMNCFNIREIQGILKRKFFTDLVNTSDNRSTLDSTLIGIRHRNNMSNILLYDQALFYNFDLTNTSKYKSFFFKPDTVYDYSVTTPRLLSSLKKTTNQILIMLPSSNPLLTINIVVKDLFLFIYPSLYTSLLTIGYSLSYVKSVFLSSFFIPNMSMKLTPYTTSKAVPNEHIAANEVYLSSSSSYSNYSKLITSNFADNSTS